MTSNYSFTKSCFLILFCLGFGGQVSAAPPTIWGAKFSTHMTLNTSGQFSQLKVVNPGASDLDVTADIIWTRGDGTEGSVSSKSLGSIDAGGIDTLLESSLLTAMGLESSNQPVDVYITLTLPDPEAFVHAEKKASDGTVALPVEKVYVLSDPNP